MHLIFLLFTFGIVTWFLCPRFFLFMDQRAAHHYVTHLDSTGEKELISTSLTSERNLNRNVDDKSRSAGDSLPKYAQCFDSLARATRSHQSTRDALITALSLLPPSQAISQILHDLHKGEEIDRSLMVQKCIRYENLFFQFLRGALVQQMFVPQALEQAGDIMRDEFRYRQEMASATAQARTSALLLTLLPFAVLVLLLFSSPAARDGALTIPFVATIVFGIAVNRLGWWWIQHMVTRSGVSAPDHSSALAQGLCISLRAGLSLRTAVEYWAAEHDLVLHHALSRGDSLSDALQEFVQLHGEGSHHLVQVLVEADRDGLPVIHTVSRLSLEMRAQRRHQAEIKMRQLPTKLALPIVLCVLPSFILLTVMPIIFVNLGRFTLSPPPLPTIS